MVAMLEVGGLAPRATGYKATRYYKQVEFAQGYIIFYLTWDPRKHGVGKFAPYHEPTLKARFVLNFRPPFIVLIINKLGSRRAVLIFPYFRKPKSLIC